LLAYNTWMGGLLSQTDPRSYPELTAVIGVPAAEKAKTLPDDANEASANARAWGAALKGMNRAAGVPPAPTPQDAHCEAEER
jgi:hypothetical protein